MHNAYNMQMICILSSKNYSLANVETSNTNIQMHNYVTGVLLKHYNYITSMLNM